MEKEKEVIPSSTWWCETCGAEEEMTQPEIIAHLKEVHGLETNGLKCRRRMVQHMDGENWYISQYAVALDATTGEIKLSNSTVNRRPGTL